MKRPCREFENIPFDKYLRWRFNLTRLLRAYHSQRIVSNGLPEVEGIELTNHCMHSCIMCPRETSMTRKKGYMEFSLFKKIVNQVAKYNRSVVLAMYGDPLLHPQIKDVIKYLKANDISVRIATNAIMLNENNANILLKTRPDYVVVALDATDEETFKKIRGKNAKYQESAENLKSFISEKNKANARRPFLHVRMIRMDINKHQIEDFKKKWSVKGVDRCDTKNIYIFDGRASFKRLDSERIFRITSQPCIRPWTAVTVLWNGLVVPCCLDYNGSYILGDLRYQNLREIWNSEKAIDLRRQFVYNDYKKVELCEGCYSKPEVPIRKFYPLN
jgi:MoaA/NifB/PqqE/SkfB family radical SAM enzyme